MEWMKFDPVKVGAEIEHLSLAAQGAYFRLMRHLWAVGPITEAEARRKCQGTFDEIADLFNASDAGMSFDWLEVLREDANRLSSIRSKVATEAKQRVTSDKQVSAIADQLPSNCLSMSVSLSHSESKSSSKSEKKERAKEVSIWPTFDDFYDAYGKKRGRPEAQRQWAKLSQQDREAVMAAIPAYVLHTPKEFRKDPERYLSKQAWNDEVIPRNTQATNGQQTDEERREERRRIIAARYADQ